MKLVDFSCKHNVLILNDDGTLQPMDQPYFRSEKVAPSTWKIESDGDFSYLVEGVQEAIVIDSGYGAGNIREYCQALTEKPIHNIANTHDHFDHTANNGYFDRAFMSEFCSKKATLPFPSFSGIDFPRDYPITILNEGDKIDLGNRVLEALVIHDHTQGSQAYLDSTGHILFTGDEIWPVKPLNISVEDFAGYLRKLAARRKEYNMLCSGLGMMDASVIDHCLTACEKVLAGEEGEPGDMGKLFPPPSPLPVDPQGRKIYRRRFPHPEDMNAGGERKEQAPKEMRIMTVNGNGILYNIHNIYTQPD